MKKVPSAQHPSLPPLFRAPSSVDNMGSDCCNTPSSPVLTLPFRVLCNTWTAAPPTLWLQYLWLIQRHLRKPPSRPQTFFLSDAFFCLSFCPVTSGISTHFFYPFTSSLYVSLDVMATHSSTLAWQIPWPEEPGRLPSLGSLQVGHDWVTSLSLSFFTFMHWKRKWQPTPVFLPGEFQGQWSLVGCRLWGRTESATTKVT